MKINCDSEGVEKATTVLKNGGVIIFPTDTVYGIGCDPFNKKSVNKIYKIKNRPKTKPFPVLVYSMNEAQQIAEFDDYSMKLAKRFWPGPLTLILKLKDKKLGQSLEIENKIAIRIPKNQCLLKLLKNCKFLVGTSANSTGEPPFTNSEECYSTLKNFDMFLDGGNIDDKGESTILEIQNGKPIIHRSGVLKEGEILEIF